MTEHSLRVIYITGIHAIARRSSSSRNRYDQGRNSVLHREEHVPAQVHEEGGHRRCCWRGRGGGGGGGQVHDLPLRVRGGRGREEAALHAPLPRRVCRPVARAEQEVSHLQGRHRGPPHQGLHGNMSSCQFIMVVTTVRISPITFLRCIVGFRYIKIHTYLPRIGHISTLIL